MADWPATLGTDPAVTIWDPGVALAWTIEDAAA